jgi:hypothetical protein
VFTHKQSEETAGGERDERERERGRKLRERVVKVYVIH